MTASVAGGGAVCGRCRPPGSVVPSSETFALLDALLHGDWHTADSATAPTRRDTSGLVVLARTPEAERHLGLQFRAHSIRREYLALVRGRAKTETIDTTLVVDRGDGRRGSGEKGQRAVTHVRVDFTPAAAGCIVTLSHAGLPARYARQMRARWTGILYGLGATLGVRHEAARAVQPRFAPRISTERNHAIPADVLFR